MSIRTLGPDGTTFVVYLIKTISGPNEIVKMNSNIHPFTGLFFRHYRVSQYQKGKTNLDFTEARDSDWQWHQLGHMQVCT